MNDWVKRALARKSVSRGRVTAEDPNEKLVWGVKFAVGMTLCLSGLEVAHMAFLGSWNSEVFAAITGLAGTVTGIFVGQKA